MFPNPAGAPVLITFAILLASIVALWIPVRFLWQGLLALAIVVGYATGVLSGPAVVPLLVLAALCWAYDRRAGMWAWPWRALLAFAILLVGLALGLHAFPGFNNPLIADGIVLSAHSAPFTLGFSFDKIVVGVLLVGLCYHGLLRRRDELLRAVADSWPIALPTIVAVIGFACILGYVDFEPKWTSFFLPWAIANLFFTCLSEEAFFRGFIQRQLDNALKGRSYGPAVAVTVSAVLFGLAHFGGGIYYVLLSTVAGAGYAIVFQRSGRIEMSMLTHFTLNTTHFLLFTYPATI